MVEGEVAARMGRMLGPVTRAPFAEPGPVLGENSSAERAVFGRVVGRIVVRTLTLATVPLAATTRRRDPVGSPGAIRSPDLAETRRKERHIQR